MKIAVTGALGHIGSRLIRELPEGSEVRLLDNLATQRYGSLFHLPSNLEYSFSLVDVTKDNLLEHFEGCDAVVHLAAIAEPGESLKQSRLVGEVNFEGTVRVGEACATASVPLIFLSTTSLYAPTRSTVSEECEASEIAPVTPYAESKYRGELALSEISKLRFTTLRFATIVGPSPGMRFHTAVNQFVWSAVNRLPIRVWTTALDQKRPYLSLHDGVEAIKFIIERKQFTGEVFNVVTENTSVREVLEVLRRSVAEFSVELVDSPTMNNLSYEVLAEKLQDRGFCFEGSLEDEISGSVRYLSGLLTPPKALNR